MPPARCTDPHSLACASQPTRRMKGRKSEMWVYSNCYEIAYPEPAELATDDPMSAKAIVHLYAFHHPGGTCRECARETGVKPSSVSSAATTLRGEGLMQPANGDGRMMLTTAGLEAALKLESGTSEAPVPPPVVDHQNERATYADVATEEDGDTVQASPVDVANTEIARLQAEVAKLTDDRDMYRHSHNAAAQQHSRMCAAFGLESIDPEGLEAVVNQLVVDAKSLWATQKALEDALCTLRAAIEKHGVATHPDDVDAALARLRALEHLPLPPVRLEWRGKSLYLLTGAWEVLIATITPMAGGSLVRIFGNRPADVCAADEADAHRRLSALLAFEGLTVPDLEPKA